MVNQRGCSTEPFSLFRLLNDLRDWQRVFLTVVTSQKVQPPFPLSLRLKHPFRIRGEVVRAKDRLCMMRLDDILRVDYALQFGMMARLRRSVTLNFDPSTFRPEAYSSQ